MTLTTKSRLAKRKLEVKEVRKENQIGTSKRHDKNCFEISERSSKDVLLKQLRVLQDKIVELDKEKEETEEHINQLKVENAKQNERNKCLEEEIFKLGNKNKSNASQPNVVKTLTGEIIMFCNKCEYPAEDIYDLGEHMYEFHCSRYEGESELSFVCEICNDGFKTDLELTAHAQKHHRELPIYSVGCNFCEEKFIEHGELMKHKKMKHKGKVAICWKFLTGNCIFGDASCWFLHSESEGSCKIPEWNCNFCETEFRCQSEMLRHKKQEHFHLVQLCRNEMKDQCIYGSQGCWFRHEKSEAVDSDASSNDKNEVIEKMFGMLEKITKRIVQIENHNLTNDCKE